MYPTPCPAKQNQRKTSSLWHSGVSPKSFQVRPQGEHAGSAPSQILHRMPFEGTLGLGRLNRAPPSCPVGGRGAWQLLGQQTNLVSCPEARGEWGREPKPDSASQERPLGRQSWGPTGVSQCGLCRRTKQGQRGQDLSKVTHRTQP